MKKLLLTLFLVTFVLNLCANAEQSVGTKDSKTNPSAIEAEINLAFWHGFNDEILINNLSSALENNIDLKITALKVKESEKIVKLSLSQELPAVDFAPLIGHTFSSSDLLRGNNNFMIKSYNQSRFLLPLYVSYEADIWGKNRLRTKSADKSLKMMEQDKKTASILLLSALGADYYNLIKIDKTLKIEKELLSLNEKLEEIIKNKELQGLATKDDVLEAKENTIKIKAKINDLTTKKEVLENQIGYLLGDKLFSDVRRNDFDSINNSLFVPEFLDSEIILNRPDVILKSENIKRAQYDARIAKKDLLPSFKIIGTFGFNGYNNLAGIFKSHTGLAEVFVAPELNIFDGGRKFHLIKLKQMELQQAQEEYQKTILNSIQEVNDALAMLKNEKRNLELQNNILNIQNEKLKLKTNNKTHGLASEADCILYQISLLCAEEKFVNDKINSIIASINLYKAIGGEDYTAIVDSQEMQKENEILPQEAEDL